VSSRGTTAPPFISKEGRGYKEGNRVGYNMIPIMTLSLLAYFTYIFIYIIIYALWSTSWYSGIFWMVGWVISEPHLGPSESIRDGTSGSNTHHTSTEWLQRTSITQSEGVMEIRINITLQGNKLTTRHMWFTQTPWVTIVHDNYQRVKPGPQYPSAGLPRDTLTGICGWLPHYPKVTCEVWWGVVQLSDHWGY
jgi:hypothetical protein